MKPLLIIMALVCINTGVLVFAQELPQSFPIETPTRMHFAASNVFGGSVRIDLNQGVLTCHRTEVNNTTSEKSIRPTAKAWRKFIRSLNAAEMYEWSPSYENHNVVDGGGWRIELTLGNREFYSKGVNDYPKDGAVYMPAKDANPSRTFTLFWTALCDLVGEDTSHFPLK